MDFRRTNMTIALNCFSLSVMLSILCPTLEANAQDTATERLKIHGVTMGTTYSVTYFDLRQRDFKSGVDSLLWVLNKAISTYDPNSEVSHFNRSKDGIDAQSCYLYPLLIKCREVFEVSKGAFDPTVMPLVNMWGFGPQKTSTIPSNRVIDSILKFVGFDKIEFDRKRIQKTLPNVQLDFGGIGQGYGADVVADFLRSKGVTNALIEIGGEGMALGRNIRQDTPWKIGILDPSSTRDNQIFKGYVDVEDRSFTTSGNYFNFKLLNGKRYGHTIDPRTGYPAENTLLSVSVFTRDAATADALATAFMVLGFEKSKTLLESLHGVEVILMYADLSNHLQIFISPAMRTHVTIVDE